MQRKHSLFIPYAYYFIFLIILSISHLVIADEKNTPLFIGVENKKIPYSYINKDEEVSGILINQLKSLCKMLKLECHFINNTMETLLYQLKTAQIQAVLVQDFFVIPEIDKIVLSLPLCKINPLFIQKKTATPKNTIEDFKGKTIGVQQASIFHIYLLDNYNSFSDIKPYIQLESGVFDLISGRIDVLFADEAFAQQRILSTSLSSNTNPDQLVPLNMKPLLKSDSDSAFSRSMSLAFRQDDIKRIDKFKSLLNKSKLKSCVDLLENSQTIISEG
jgi:lysine/arginine/ornithine transport system substrate-binding protein